MLGYRLLYRFSFQIQFYFDKLSIHKHPRRGVECFGSLLFLNF